MDFVIGLIIGLIAGAVAHKTSPTVIGSVKSIFAKGDGK